MSVRRVVGALVVRVTATAACAFPGSCSRDEFACDNSRCLLPASLCDGRPDCRDQTDEANCSQKHKGAAWRGGAALPHAALTLTCLTDCGGPKTGPSGFLSSPNHPRNYPHQQVHVRMRQLLESGSLLISPGPPPLPPLPPPAVHMALICGGRSRHHAELQQLQPGDSGCL